MNPVNLRRLFATQIDVMIGAIPVVVCSIVTDGMEGNVRATIQIIALLATLFLVLFKDFSGQSVGKRLLGLRIVDATTRLTNKGRKNVLRNLLFVLWPIEAVFLLFGGMQRRWVDRALGLDVVGVA